jgi:diguanylate cyclase (GGDEF)-like protein/PAS domain S-box-containing protein
MMSVPRTTTPDVDASSPSTAQRIAWIAAATIVGALVVLYVLHPEGTPGNLTYYTVTVGAPIVAGLAVLMRRTDRRVGVLVSLGLAASAAGDLIWQAYVTFGGAAPDVSPADLGWLASYVLVGWALMILVRRSDYRLRRDPDALLDMSVVAVLVALAVWMLWVSPTLADTTTPWMVRSVSAVYPVLDAALLGLMVRLLLHRTVRGPSVVLLAAGLGSWLVADLGYLAVDSSWSETMTDAGWMLGSALIAAAVWTLRDVDARSVTRRRGAELGRTVRPWRVVLEVLPLAVPWLVALWAYRRGWRIDPLPLFIASVALGALLCARTLHLLKLQRETKDLYRAAALHSSDATLIVAGDGRLLQDAPGLGVLLHDESLGAAGSSTADLAGLSPSGEGWFHDLVGRVLERPGHIVERELPVRLRDGAEIWLLLRVVNLLDEPGVHAVLVNVHDISDRKAVEAELEHQAFHDPLTALPNRSLFADRLDHAVAQRARTGMDPSVLFLDVDHFKAVNDRLGHVAGDQLLQAIADRLATSVRAGDTVARLGGDEFAVLIEHSADTLADAQDVAHRMLERLLAPVEIEGTSITVTASIGIAPGSPNATADSLLRDADTAMYHAKAAGRARAVVYSAEMRERDELRVRVEADLPAAIEQRELRLEYQPVVDLISSDVVGFEALLRWTHPTLGEVPPDVFIPAAERSGAIVELGEWVLRTACDQAARWRRDLSVDVTMAVNLSGRQLAEPSLTDVVLDALDRSGLAPQHLVLEITETAVIGDTDEARSVLSQLRDHGVHVAVDDFGTGYSSLSYLRELPVDILKIDRSFINAVREGMALPEIVQGILDLAHTLHLGTVAEGIESTTQLEQLRASGCEVGQGYLFARSLPPQAAAELLSGSGRALHPADRAVQHGSTSVDA